MIFESGGKENRSLNGAANDSDRRENTRVQVDMDGELFLGDRMYSAMMLNVSLGGCLIETSARPRLREILTFQVRQGDSMEEFKLKVAWQSYGQGLGKIGARFYGMTEEKIRTAVAGILGASRRNEDSET